MKLSEEFARILAEKQAKYERHKKYQQDMIIYDAMKQNVGQILETALPDQRATNGSDKATPQGVFDRTRERAVGGLGYSPTSVSECPKGYPET